MFLSILIIVLEKKLCLFLPTFDSQYNFNNNFRGKYSIALKFSDSNKIIKNYQVIIKDTISKIQNEDDFRRNLVWKSLKDTGSHVSTML